VTFNEVHNLLMRGIDESKDTILRHGHVVGQADEHFGRTDIAAGRAVVLFRLKACRTWRSTEWGAKQPSALTCSRF